MGKIRVTTLGSEKEDQLREKQKVRREEKKKREEAKRVHIAGMKGGERIKTVGAESEEEIEKLAKLAEEVEKVEEGAIKTGLSEQEETEKEKKSKKKRRIHIRSKRYKAMVMKIDPTKRYAIPEALALLRLVSLTAFDATVELHINTIEKGLRGSVQLPHGTGKKIKVAIADTATIDKLTEDIQKGKIDFDALVAHPQVMAKLAKVAKYLGPKGLMPNPKAGTISTEPEKVAKKLAGGEITWKTEGEFPIIHQIIGKLSFTDEQLIGNFNTIIKSVGEAKIKNITLKSTMSPGIKVQI
ncbi:hypothetical protein FJY90_05445 [Candidatus Gottesmanbacteria bacterium]|nr:hypothetical protein [Candidatus Gottesmanbacteria bacterium]